MDPVTLVRDIMTGDVISTTPEASILDVFKILSEKHFNGLPVLNEKGELVGLVTQYNLIASESLLHVPTLEKVSKNPNIEPSELQFLSDQVRKTAALKVSDVMEKEPLTLRYDENFEAALAIFNQHHRINPVPVVDENKKLVGIVSRYDLLKLLKLFGHT